MDIFTTQGHFPLLVDVNERIDEESANFILHLNNRNCLLVYICQEEKNALEIAAKVVFPWVF
jgi:hypothetical protein